MKAQSDFHVHTNYISNHLLLHRSMSAEEALQMATKLDQWAATLPDYFQLETNVTNFEQWYLFARSRLWWRFWNLKIILLRQILLRKASKSEDRFSGADLAQSENECIAACLNAAHMTISSIHGYLNHAETTKLIAWYST
jgi:transcriptional regulatory protein GAL4